MDKLKTHKCSLQTASQLKLVLKFQEFLFVFETGSHSTVVPASLKRRAYYYLFNIGIKDVFMCMCACIHFCALGACLVPVEASRQRWTSCT